MHRDDIVMAFEAQYQALLREGHSNLIISIQYEYACATNIIAKLDGMKQYRTIAIIEDDALQVSHVSLRRK